MKILTIQAAYFPMIGGAEIFHQKNAEYMVKKGHHVDVLTCVWDKPDINWRNWQKKEEIINGVKIYRVKPWFLTQYFKTIGSIWPLYKKALTLIKDENYDLIHCHIFPANIVGAMLKIKTRLPLLTTIQGGDLADYSETGSTFAFLLRPFINFALKKADFIHVVSTYLQKQIVNLNPNVILIPNGVDQKLFKPRNKKLIRIKYNLPLNKFIIISHSRLTYKNGLDILLKAFNKLVSKRDDLILLIVGGGEEEMNLKKYVFRNKLEKIVLFLGYKSINETAELLSASDLFVRPSRQEGFGISFIEALSSGIPVIGTKVGGIVDIIKVKKSNQLIEPNSVKKLYKALLKHNFKGTSFKVSKNINQYNWNNIGLQIEKLYLFINKKKS